MKDVLCRLKMLNGKDWICFYGVHCSFWLHFDALSDEKGTAYAHGILLHGNSGIDAHERNNRYN